MQTKQNHAIRLIFFVRAFGEQTDSTLPLINLLELLTVNNVYRLHALRFTHLWHKNFLPNVFYNFFKYAGSLHTYNTRYAASQNLSKTRVRTNTEKQTISYMASIFWHNIPPYMKNLNVYQFSKQIKLYLFSLWTTWKFMKYLTFWTFNSFEYPLLIWFGLSPCVCTLFTHLFTSLNLILFCT